MSDARHIKTVHLRALTSGIRSLISKHPTSFRAPRQPVRIELPFLHTDARLTAPRPPARGHRGLGSTDTAAPPVEARFDGGGPALLRSARLHERRALARRRRDASPLGR